MPEKNNEKNIFRIAAVLYKDGNYVATRKTTIRKFVETVFIDTDNDSISPILILQHIEKNYKISFSEEEIIESLNESYFIHCGEGYSLEKKRYNQLKNILNNQNNIYTYIDEYLESIKSKDRESDKEEIFRFLYDTFTKNIHNYENFLNNQRIETNNLNESSYNIELINNFLEYKSTQKNKIIFDIMSLSLEYCLLTNKKNNWGLSQLKNKVFYIDSNVIYRALGLNGENRQITTVRFMEKCRSIDINFKVLPITIDEFKSSVKLNTERIRRNQKGYNTKVSPEVYSRYSKDYFRIYYYEWTVGNPNDTQEDFINYIEAKMRSFFDDYSIEVDFNFTRNFGKINDEGIYKTDREIYSYKSNRGMSVTEQTSFTDAQLVEYLNYKRGNDTSMNIGGNKYFLISTDQGLKNWVTYFNIHSTLVMLPTDWMTIMLRYINRTEDDYASYTSFLTLKMSDPVMRSVLEVDTVINSIAKHVDTAEEQKYYMETIFGNNMLEVIIPDKDKNDIEKIDSLVSDYVKKDLEKRIFKLEMKDREREREVEIYRNKESKANKKVKLLINEELKSWQNRGILFGIILSTIGIFSIVFSIWFQNFKFNYIVIINQNLENLTNFGSDLIKNIILIPLLLLIGSQAYKNFMRKNINSNIYISKVEELEKKYKI